MRPVITARLVVVLSVTTALSSIGASARRVSPISTRTTGGPFQYEVVAGDSLVSLVRATASIHERSLSPTA